MSPVQMSIEAFDELVRDAIDALPDWTAPFVAELAVLVHDQPEPGTTRPGTTLLGLFHGFPLTAHGGRVPGSVPSAITLYRLPILASCASVEEAPARVHTVLGHEVGHAVGIDEKRLRELGWY